MSPLQGTAFSIPPNARSQVARSLSGCTKLLGLWWVYQSAALRQSSPIRFSPDALAWLWSPQASLSRRCGTPPICEWGHCV